MVTTASVTRRAPGWAAVVLALGCARHPGPPPAPGAPREIRIAHDYGLGGPGPLLVVGVGAGGLVRGAVFVRAPGPIPGLPDSLAALLRAGRDAAFARAGCREPVEMGRALACPARFRGPGPDWGAALRVLESALAADSAAERAEAPARRPAVGPGIPRLPRLQRLRGRRRRGPRGERGTQVASRPGGRHPAGPLGGQPRRAGRPREPLGRRSLMCVTPAKGTYSSGGCTAASY